MAYAIAHDLVLNTSISEVVVGDIQLSYARQLASAIKSKKVKPVRVDATNSKQVLKLIRGSGCVIGATTYSHNLGLTRACLTAKTNFCDLGGNVDVVRAQLALNKKAKSAGVTVIPDCGLAPGMVNVLAYHWASRFDSLHSIRIRVGGLPQKPENLLNYQLVFSVEGLINEYKEPAVVLENSRQKIVPSLTGTEELFFPPPFGKLEAFYTSGGSSTLPDTLKGRVKNLDYKTIRYPGHAHLMKFLNDLGYFREDEEGINGVKVPPRRVTARLLTKYLPENRPDSVLVRVRLEGTQKGKEVVETFDCIDLYDPKTKLTAMQRTTGFPVAIIAQMLATGKISEKGVIPQELAVPGDSFLAELESRNIRFTRN